MWNFEPLVVHRLHDRPEMNTSELIYDWNKNHPPGLKPPGPVLLNDESLRDGLQSPSVRDPSISEKIEILHLMEALGIDSLDLGLPGAGPRAVEHVTALAREIVAHKLKIRANCAARTHENDIRPIAEIVQKTGLPIEAATFIGSSPIRRFTEGWSDDFLLQTTEKAVKYAVSLGLDVMYVTEDTSRCDPETVKRLYTTAINCGARAIAICDTAGHATPMGALALVRFVIAEVVKPSGERIRVDWHGHSDRGLAIANSMAAIIAGANCVHGCAIGLGERVGNTQIDQMLVNLKLMGIAPWDHQDLTKLEALLPGSVAGYGCADSRKLSRSRGRCVSYGDGRPRRGHHQGLSQERRSARELGLLGRTFPCVRTGADHRHRSHEWQVECALLAGTAWHPGYRRIG